MEIMHLIDGRQVVILDNVEALPENGFIWLDFVCDAKQNWNKIVETLTGIRVHERHVHDSLNLNHPSFYDGIQDYEMLIFRGLATTSDELSQIQTRPTVFFIFDKLLVTVRPNDSVSIPLIRSRLKDKTVRLPKRPVGLMHLVLGRMVDRFLEMREPLIDKLVTWRTQLLDPNHPFDDWMSVMQHNTHLRKLEMLCDEQYDAIIAWRESTNTDFDDHLAVRYTDLIEHIQRVSKFAAEQKGEVDALVQMHFSAVAHRTNEIVRLLTVISAIFLPLTLIAGIFGMNFEHMPELKMHNAYFITLGGMFGLGITMLLLFFKKRWI